MSGHQRGIALGFIGAMEQRGRRTPRDFSIIGVDDMPAAAFFSPPLSTMRLDFQALGANMFCALHQQILTGDPIETVDIEPVLVVRSTTRTVSG